MKSHRKNNLKTNSYLVDASNFKVSLCKSKKEIPLGTVNGETFGFSSDSILGRSNCIDDIETNSHIHVLGLQKTQIPSRV